MLRFDRRLKVTDTETGRPAENPDLRSVASYELIILGAGPAGAAALLACQGAGVRIAVVDRAEFPRDKVCGDAIPGPGVKWLRNRAPDVHADLFDLAEKSIVRRSSLTVDGGHTVGTDWQIETFNAPREHFDAHLLALCRARTAHDFYQQRAKRVTETEEDVRVELADGQTLTARHLIAADGANGVCARQLLQREVDYTHHCAAVRQYWTLPAGTDLHTNEFHLLRRYLPGYFWIFPVDARTVNVGFGMRSHELRQRKGNLRRLLPEILAETPHLRARFRDAQPLEQPVGFGLPLGTARAPLVTRRTLFTGDAGSLIDPLYGHGIDKAIISGWLAAEHALRDDLPGYERTIYDRWTATFRTNARYRDWMTRFPRAVEWGTRLAAKPVVNQWLRNFVNA